VTLLRAGDAPLVLMSLASRGLLVLPLVVSLPLLLLPAWLSVRLALRPWRQLAREMETRTPDDLSPLRFQPRHAELQPLVRALDRLLSRVRDGVQRERSFIADAAHELRTPLAAMRVHVEALQQRPLADGDRHLLDGLGRSGERASRLVAQLLALMRSDARRSSPDMGRLSLVALAQDRLAALAPLAEAREVELEFSGAREALVDGEREGMTSLLDNLIENAIKYSPAGGTVRVSVHASAQTSAQASANDGPPRAELSVEDEGPGIAPEHRERVFDRFYRVPDQSLPGSGLGLAIVRSVAERHRATLRLDDREHGPGLRVTVGFAAATGLSSVLHPGFGLDS
jgi:two-component system sensor histidine kinase QseC